MTLASKEGKENLSRSILLVVLSFLGTFALNHINIAINMNDISILGQCLLFIILLMISFAVIHKKQFTIVELVFALLISLVCTYSCIGEGFVFIPIFIGFAYIFFLCKHGVDRLTTSSMSRVITSLKKRTVILVTGSVLLMAWCIYIIAYYPGIGFYDSLWQLSQFYGYTAFSTHHPVMSSIVMGIITYPGSLIGSDALFLSYVGLQLVLSVIFFTYVTYSSLNILQNNANNDYVNITVKNLTLYFILLFVFSCIPIYPLYSVTFMKDVLYAVALCFCIVILFKKYRDEKISSWLFGISLFIVAAFRNEGIVIALTIATIYITYSADKKKIAKKFAIFFAAFLCVNTALGVLLHVNHGSPIEMFALPDQQIAREIRDHSDSFTKEEIQELNKMLISHDFTVLGDKFNTESADYVKMEFDSGEYSRKTIIRIWLRHLVLHPATFIAATLDTTNGYYNPLITKHQGTFFDSLQWFNHDTTDTWRNTFGLPNNALHPSNMGVNSDLRASLAQAYAYVLNHKAISWILSPATYFWIFLCELCICIEQRKYKLALTFIPLLLVCGMCALSPINGSMRYALPIIYASIALLPFIAHAKQMITEK